MRGRGVKEQVAKRTEGGYRCACGREHRFNAYVYAQTAMGHDLTHACDCGRTNTVGGRTQVVTLGAHPRGRR
jgi:hypothetical protein